MSLIRKLLRPLIGIVISIAFLALALFGRDFAQIAQAFTRADYRFVVLAAVCTFLSYAWRTRRWVNFLAPQKKIPFTRLYPLLIIGFALNNILPGRPGEFVRAYSLGQREGISKMLGLATIVFERVADGLTLVTFLALVSLLTDLPGWEQQLEIVAVGIFFVGIAGLVFLLVRENLARRVFEWSVHRLPAPWGERLTRMFSSFILGLHSLRSPTDLLNVITFSALTWFTEATHYFLILTAFSLLPDLGTRAIASGVMMVVVNLGIMIPAAPGGIGPFEYAGVLTLGAFGVPQEIAFSATLVAHGIQYAVVTVQGLFFTAREGIGFAQAAEES